MDPGLHGIRDDGIKQLSQIPVTPHLQTPTSLVSMLVPHYEWKQDK